MVSSEGTLKSERMVKLIGSEKSQLFMAAVLVSLPNTKLEPVAIVATQNVGCRFQVTKFKITKECTNGFSGPK